MLIKLTLIIINFLLWLRLHKRFHWLTLTLEELDGKEYY